MTEDGITTFLSTRAEGLRAKNVLQQSVIDELANARERLRLGIVVRALLRPTSISEEQLIGWNEREETYNPEGVQGQIDELLKQVSKLHGIEGQKNEVVRKKDLDGVRVQK